MFGAALGDALGSRFHSFPSKSMRNNIIPTDLETLFDAQYELEISNETQMALFTAEGLLRSETREHVNGISHTPSVVYSAYLRWLFTQGYDRFSVLNEIYDGYLISLPEMRRRKYPGIASISALRTGEKGEISEPINNSRGSDGIARTHPIGLFFEREYAFKIGCECCAITHGNAAAYLAAGAFAHIISSIMSGMNVKDSLKLALSRLESENGHLECSKKLSLALDLFEMNLSEEKSFSIIGDGWKGHEALAMGVYCALNLGKEENNFKEAFLDKLIMLSNYSRNTSSIGSVMGSIMGVLMGEEYIPEKLWTKMKCHNLIEEICLDLNLVYSNSDMWVEKYPGH